jgi:hypothetical protein
VRSAILCQLFPGWLISDLRYANLRLDWSRTAQGSKLFIVTRSSLTFQQVYSPMASST